MKKKPFVLLLAFVLIVGCVVGGTLAWLTDTTETIENIFTVGNVDIALTESDDLNLKMIPGCTITKDPKVTVEAGSEKCWLFVKVEKSGNFDAFMTYTMADGWSELTEGSGIFYQNDPVDASAAAKEFAVLAGNTVTVSDTVTKTMMDTLTESTLPTLKFTAYACQYQKGDTNFTAEDAWAAILGA